MRKLFAFAAVIIRGDRAPIRPVERAEGISIACRMHIERAGTRDIEQVQFLF